MTSLNTIRTISVRYQSEGADKFRSDAAAVTVSQERMGQAAQAAANVTEQASKRQLSAAAAYEKVRQSVDSAAKAQAQYDRAAKTVERAALQGVIDRAEQQATLEAAHRRYFPQGGGNDNHAAAGGGLSSYDRQFIRYQGFDVASSLGSGASPLTVAAQQGPQVLQQLADREGGLGAGLKALGVTALGMVTPFTVAATAVTAIGAAFVLAGVQAGRQQEALEKATRGVGAATGATAAQLDALAKANATAGQISVGTAREIAAGYASTGQVVLPVIGDLIARTSEYAKITGQEIPAATTELARLFADPAKGAEELAAKLGGLDDRTRSFIQTQVENGDRTAAQTALADVLKASIDANTSATGAWAQAWNTAAAAAGSYWEAAKRIAGIKLGIAPEGAADATARLTSEVDKANRIRAGIGADPLGLGDSRVVQRDTAALVADTERRQAEARAAEERADKASRAAGEISRSYDPQLARLSELKTQQSSLRDALSDPLTRSKVDIEQTESAYRAATRAVESLTDGTGKLIDRQEMARRADQLRMDALKATTDQEKAAVAERQKAFDLIGKTIEGSDARGQIARAGQLSLAGASEKGGGSKGEARDEYDRATKSIEDRIRRQQEDAATYGMGAAAVARYRAETELLTAAKRAERDITPELTAQIQGYAQQAAEAAEKQEALRDSMRAMDGVRSTGKEVFGGVFQDISKGTSAANVFANALGKIQSRILDLASTSLTDALFGKSGTSGSGLFGGGGGFLSSLFGGGGSAAANAPLAGAQGPTFEGAGLLSSISSIFGFANNGIMGPNGQIPLHTYSNGGIANSPQMAVFGEGRMPEAYVPLPDGKRIPVTMAAPANGNGGGKTDINTGGNTYNITPANGVTKAELIATLQMYDREQNRTILARVEDARRRHG